MVSDPILGGDLGQRSAVHPRLKLRSGQSRTGEV